MRKKIWANIMKYKSHFLIPHTARENAKSRSVGAFKKRYPSNISVDCDDVNLVLTAIFLNADILISHFHGQ